MIFQFLPGQSIIWQLELSVDGPRSEQSFPPCIASGLVQFLYLNITPPPQDDEHADQADQVLKPPLTGKEKKMNMVTTGSKYKSGYKSGYRVHNIKLMFFLKESDTHVDKDAQSSVQTPHLVPGLMQYSFYRHGMVTGRSTHESFSWFHFHMTCCRYSKTTMACTGR